MLDHPSSTDFDFDALAEALGSLPEAPLAMPKQALERRRDGQSLLPLMRLFGARSPRTGH